MKAFWVQMIDLDLFSRYLKGRCYGNQFCRKMENFHFSSLWHSETEWDTATSVCALTLTISFEKFVNFGPVTPELTELNCGRLVHHGQKTGVFSRICPDILDRFSQSFHHMKALLVQMMNLDLIF